MRHRVTKENRADRHLTMITLERVTPQNAMISKTCAGCPISDRNNSWVI